MITGAAGGIGSSVAEHFAQEGAKLALVDKDEKKLDALRDKFLRDGVSARSYRVELANATEIDTLFKEIERDFKGLDILINNAGLGKWVSPLDLTIDQWDYVIAVNLTATFLCSRLAAKLMEKSGRGSIINIASTRALMSEPNSEAYAASKGGILALTHALAISLGPLHIPVNAISPGWIEFRDYEGLKPSDHSQHPSGRVGKPSDIARACLYLSDPQNDFITGQNLIIDGGMTKKMIYEE